MKRVVITGTGIYSTIGKNIEEVRDSLYKGKSGIGIDPRRIEYGFNSPLTGILEIPNLKGVISRRERIGLAEQGIYSYVSTMEALKMAKIDQDFLNVNEVGILFGNDSSTTSVIETADILREHKKTTPIGSGAIFQSMNSTISMNLSVILKLRGINFTLSGACASSSHAIGMAYVLIRQGLQDIVVCGGGQEVNAESMASFDALDAFAKNIDEPTKASRPFDRDRNGLVPSGGAATVIVESLDSALARGANILGEIKGYGFSSNGDHISVPNIEGPARSLENCLKDAQMQPSEIDYINAHATSTPAGDMNEAMAIKQIFGDSNVPISSTKSMTGHEMWMGGASEVIYSMLMMEYGFIAPNINLENIDDQAKGMNIVATTQEAKINTLLSNSFGFGGTNSTLIISKYKK
jgi:3-oxoacyl-[acyl-carrier-protein] synthase-1